MHIDQMALPPTIFYIRFTMNRFVAVSIRRFFKI